MATLINLFRSFGFQSQQGAADSDQNSGFTPLSTDYLARLQGGFDLDDDPVDDDANEGGEDPVLEPVSGEIVDDKVDGE